MRFKTGVYVRGISPELLVGLAVMDKVYEENGYRMTVTSVSDSRHSEKSLHYSGRAADLRTYDLGPETTQTIHQQGRRELPMDFDLVLEADHFHLEYDPKGKLP